MMLVHAVLWDVLREYHTFIIDLSAKFAAARSMLRAVLHLHRNQIGDGGATILGEAVK